MRVLSRAELTAALAVRQLLIERQRIAPAEAVRRLTPLQGQHPPAPFIALAARLEGFERSHLEAAIEAGAVVKTTINRLTLHLCDAGDYPAFAQLTRQTRMRTWRKLIRPPRRGEGRPPSWRPGCAEPRTNAEIRERVWRYDGVDDQTWAPIIFARTLLPLVQLPPAGFWEDARRASFVLDPRPRPDPADAAAVVLARYLEAFGPAGRRDAAAWAGVAQRDFADAFERLETVSFRDEHGTELLDLPGAPAAAGRHAAPAPLPRPLGPAAAGLCPARPHHPARAPAAEADAQRRPDRDRRRPRRRELEHRGRAHHDHAAHRDQPRRAQADPRGGGAHGATSARPRRPATKWPGSTSQPRSVA